MKSGKLFHLPPFMPELFIGFFDSGKGWRRQVKSAAQLFWPKNTVSRMVEIRTVNFGLN